MEKKNPVSKRSGEGLYVPMGRFLHFGCLIGVADTNNHPLT
jgi:hypothetical protein